MSAVETLQAGLSQLISDLYKVNISAAQIPLEHPAEEERGDYASAVAFRLTKELKKKPEEIAAELAERLNGDLHVLGLETILDRAVAEGPFVNLWLSPSYLADNLACILNGKYAVTAVAGNGPTIIEYSSPNIGKPFGIGHLRSTVNGHAIGNLLEAQGHKVVRLNYLGDWGTQFGKLIVAYKKWGEPEAMEQDATAELQRVYVKFHNEMENDETLLEQGRAWFAKLEQGDKEATKLWQEFREHSLEAFNKIYDLLEVKIQEDPESAYAKKFDKTLELLESHKLLKESDGATIVELPDKNMPPILIKKQDQSSLYATREIAAAIDRHERYNFAHMLYEVGNEQELHFRQIFALLGMLKLDWVDKLEHIKHGLYVMGDKKMSTRAGRTVSMESILKEAIARADKVIAQKNPDLPNRAEVARQVGIGAVKYHDLSQNRLTNIQFDFDRMLSLDGNSAPYLQYTHARALSVLTKAKTNPKKLGKEKLDPAALEQNEERLLLRRLVRFEEVIADAANRRLPHLVATEIYELAGMFNVFYANVPIIKAEGAVRTNRLLITAAVAKTIARGLELLGIAAPERM